MKLDRLMGILTVLMQNDRVTAPYLAEKFEVNRRTIGRDIDALCQAGIPIITHQGVGGGISIADGFKLDKSVLTTDELSGIISALKGIGTVSESTHIERVLDKLGANAVVSMREPIIIDLASHYKDNLTAKINQIKTAIGESRCIEFDYYYEKGQSRRCIEPYYVIFQWSSWYVFGFCRQRQDWRMFKLMRLWGLCICDEHYTLQEVPDMDFNDHFTAQHMLVAVFAVSERYKLIESYGLDCYVETNEGLRFEFGFTNRDYMVSWLLSFGKNVKVLEPAYVAQEIRDIARNILSHYE